MVFSNTLTLAVKRQAAITAHVLHIEETLKKGIYIYIYILLDL